MYILSSDCQCKCEMLFFQGETEIQGKHGSDKQGNGFFQCKLVNLLTRTLMMFNERTESGRGLDGRILLYRENQEPSKKRHLNCVLKQILSNKEGDIQIWRQGRGAYSRRSYKKNTECERIFKWGQ